MVRAVTRIGTAYDFLNSAMVISRLFMPLLYFFVIGVVERKFGLKKKAPDERAIN
jgi:hypothetical protein